jgi:hypothetical protein
MAGFTAIGYADNNSGKKLPETTYNILLKSDSVMPAHLISAGR